MSRAVELESIRDCLQGGLPAPLATCGPDGMPHISYVSRVEYLDGERVATTRQPFNAALVHLEASPFAQALVTRPGTGDQFRLDLRWLHTTTDGDAFEGMRATFEGIAAHTGMGAAFRLRALDVHRVLRCTSVRSAPRASEPAADPMVALERFVRRLERATSADEVRRELLDALDDLFGLRDARLVLPDEIPPGEGLIGTAAARRRVVVMPNLDRAHAMAAAVGDAREAHPGTARTAAAVPLVVGRDVLGVLYLESTAPGAFNGQAEGLLRIVGAHAAAALGARSAPRSTPAPGGAAPLELVHYRADDTVLCDSAYVVKGAPGRILWSMLKAHAVSGRTTFTNRELRLDESLGLPAGNDNLESRLLVLRRRLADLDCGVRLERVGRGQLVLGLERQAELTEIPSPLR